MYEYNAKLIRVVDGDTLDCDIDLGFEIHTQHKLRLARINCPEKCTDEGKFAAQFVKQFEGQTIRIISSKIDKYGRYLAEVFVKLDNSEVNLNDLLLSKGMAKIYT
jgi:micrococcal nuclease